MLAMSSAACSTAVQFRAGPTLDGTDLGFVVGLRLCSGPPQGQRSAALLCGGGTIGNDLTGLEVAADLAWSLEETQAWRAGVDAAESFFGEWAAHAHVAWLRRASGRAFVGLEGALGAYQSVHPVPSVAIAGTYEIIFAHEVVGEAQSPSP
jgi:hypothetical protein